VGDTDWQEPKVRQIIKKYIPEKSPKDATK
jgi:hypothetical protein